MSQDSVTFTNKSNLPIILETIQQISHRMSVMKSVIVKSGETITLLSSTGEWLLDTYICDTEMVNEWLDAGYKVGTTIGKFRNKPCARGDYSWMFEYKNNFQIVYDKDTNTATFSNKSK